MLAYVFWHMPSADVDTRQYEAALVDFMHDLSSAPSPGFASCTTCRISKVAWLSDQPGYEDWYFVRSCADLDALNDAAVNPARWDVHAAIATKMGRGYGGLYKHLHGDDQPRDGARAAWLTRPRGIRFQDPLRKIVDGSTGVLSCWRRHMVLGPADEFVLIGTEHLNISLPAGWQARIVERTILPRQQGGSPFISAPLL